MTTEPDFKPAAQQTPNELRADDHHKPPVYDFAPNTVNFETESQKWLAVFYVTILCLIAVAFFYMGYLTYPALNPLGDF